VEGFPTGGAGFKPALFVFLSNTKQESGDVMGKMFQSLVMVSVISLLSAPRFTESAALTAAAIGSLKASVDSQPATGGGTAPALDRASVLTVAATLNASGVGDGLMKIEQASADKTLSNDALQKIADNKDVLALDSAVRLKPADVSTLGAGLITPRKVGTSVNVATPTTPLRAPKKAAVKKSSRRAKR